MVVGGGPAGLIAARELASAGYSVRVLEEHDIIGAPVHCTGVLGLDAFDELHLSRRSIVGAADRARFVSPNGTTVMIEGGRVRAAVVDRALFDRDLATSAIAGGAIVQTGVRVASVTRAARIGDRSYGGRRPGHDPRARGDPRLRRQLPLQSRARSRRAERPRP